MALKKYLKLTSELYLNGKPAHERPFSAIKVLHKVTVYEL